MHRDKPFGAEIAKDVHRFVRSHVNIAKGIRVIRPDREQGDLRGAAAANLLEAIRISAVAGVVNAASLVLEDKTAVAAVLVVKGARAPMFARRERHGPVGMGKTFPSLQFD